MWHSNGLTRRGEVKPTYFEFKKRLLDMIAFNLKLKSHVENVVSEKYNQKQIFNTFCNKVDKTYLLTLNKQELLDEVNKQ